MKKLMTPQREKFCQEVAKHGNATAAHLVAFPKSLLWAEKSVNQVASRLMSDVKVASRISMLRAAVEKRTNKTREDWLAEVVSLGWNKKNKKRLEALVQYGKAQGYYVQRDSDVGDREQSCLVIVMPAPAQVEQNINTEVKEITDAKSDEAGSVPGANQEPGGAAVAVGRDEPPA